VTALEALVRWPHPKRGPLSPDLFVAMAEETGHIRQLTDFVLARALADQQALLACGHDLAISVNLSGRLVGDEDFTAAALAQAAQRGGKLCLELTETAVIDNPGAALAQLDRFAAAGIEISIDDYGSGLSSLAYLKRIKASELKIDKVFVMGMADSQRDALLIRSTIDLAHGLGMRVVAEGVEGAAAAALLTGMGCDFAQGYFIARPAPLKELLRFLDETKQNGQANASRGDVREPSIGAGADGELSSRAGLRPG
jgi:EAL domain-containing protein (putative c-di-GMP-specific phosphodiesterase class I)